MGLFRGVSPTLGEPSAAGEAVAQFVETELDSLLSPAEDTFGWARVTVEGIVGDVGLEESPLGTSQESGSLAQGLDRVFRERLTGAPRWIKDTGRMT
jgi:hypothetical protein